MTWRGGNELHTNVFLPSNIFSFNYNIRIDDINLAYFCKMVWKKTERGK